MALNQNREIDQRTSQAKSIREIKQAIREDLDETARALLEADAAVCAVIQQMALKQAFSQPDKIVNEQGKACYAIGTWRKYGTQKKSALLALKKFQTKAELNVEADLGSIILGVTEDDENG